MCDATEVGPCVLVAARTKKCLRIMRLGRLSHEAIESVGQHIELCPDCQAQVAEFDDVSEELVDRLVGNSLGSPFAGEADRERALATGDVGHG